MTNNRVHYYLPDAQGGSVGMLLDDDGDPTTPGHAAFQTYDAFGNAMSKTFTAAGSFAWRGGEGSVTRASRGDALKIARQFTAGYRMRAWDHSPVGTAETGCPSVVLPGLWPDDATIVPSDESLG